MAGQNHDGGKTKWELLPYDGLEYVARVLTQACSRKDNPYPPRNWEQGMDWSRAFGSAERHARDFAMGIRLDHETGLPTSAHAAFRWLQLLTYQVRNIGLDDMLVGGHRKELGPVEAQFSPLEEVLYKGEPAIVLNRSALEPHRWVCRTLNSGTTFYASTSDLTKVEPASDNPVS